MPGYKTAATTVLPDAVTVMDPFHVVALAGVKLDLCRQRVQQDTTGHRGRSGDPLYRVRRTLRTRLALLTDRQRARLEAVFAVDEHVAVSVTWLSRPGARCRDLSRSVSPGRSPNRTCGSHRIRLSTKLVVTPSSGSTESGCCDRGSGSGLRLL